MKFATVAGFAACVVAISGIAHAVPAAHKVVRVVAGAKALSTAEKASVTGMCDCDEPTKPGYGFGAKVEHYGPPGQGFSGDLTWREQKQVSDSTPRGTQLPPTAFRFPGTRLQVPTGGDCGGSSGNS